MRPNLVRLAALMAMLVSFGVLADDFTAQPIIADPTPRSIFTSMVDFLPQGVSHILFGWDHLAFVFCITILASNLRTLIWLITAFTIGHSLSMAVAYLDIVTIPIPPIEAVIAISIVLMARQAWFSLPQQFAQMSVLHPSLVIFCFGLIHGMGFASALDQLDVFDGDKLAALLFFNIGVELGQVSFVLALVGVISLLKRINIEYVFSKVSLACIGSAGVFWTLQRVLSF